MCWRARRAAKGSNWDVTSASGSSSAHEAEQFEQDESEWRETKDSSPATAVVAAFAVITAASHGASTEKPPSLHGSRADDRTQDVTSTGCRQYDSVAFL